MNLKKFFVLSSKHLLLVVLYIFTFIVTGATLAPDEIGGQMLAANYVAE